MSSKSPSHYQITLTLPNPSPRLKRILAFLPLLLVCLYLLRPLLHPWFPLVTDGEYYLARLGNYFVALQEGQFLPRWAPTFKFGFGYPVFNYNYPLPNLIGVTFMFFGQTAQTAMKLLFSMSLLSAAAGMYAYLSSRFRTLPAFVGSLLYATAPYLTYDMFLRGTYGELVALGLFPWALLSLELYLRRPSRPRFFFIVASISLLFLSHNIMALFSLALITFYLLLNHHLKELTKLLYPFLLSLCLVSFFWLPALFEARYTVMSERSLYQNFATNLKPLWQLTRLTLSRPSPSLENMRQIGYPQLAALSLTLIFLLHASVRSRFALTFFLAAVASIFFITPESRFLWQLLPGVNFLQHPFRLLFVTAISTSLLAAWITSKLSPKPTAILLIALLIVNYYFFYTTPSHYVPYADDWLTSYPLTSAAADEFDPPWYDKKTSDNYISAGQEPYAIVSGAAAIIIDFWNGTTRSYRAQIDTPTTIVERTLYFPGWQTRIDGQLIDLNATKGNFGGLINYTLPVGSHTVTTRFTQFTPARFLGNSLTLIGLAAFIISTLLFSRFKPQPLPAKPPKRKT